MPPTKLCPFQKIFKLIVKIIDYRFSFLLFYGILFIDTQVSPSGMASASQADFGGSDSRHLLQNGQVLLYLPILHLIMYILIYFLILDYLIDII